MSLITAQSHLTKIIHTQALVYIARQYFCSHHQHSRGVYHLNKALKYSQNTSTLSIDNAFSNLDIALQNLSELENESKEYTHAKLLQAALYNYRGETEQALNVFTELSRTISNDNVPSSYKFVNMGLAECYLQLGNPNKALKHSLQALQNCDKYERARFLAGRIFFEHFDQVEYSEPLLAEAIDNFSKLPSNEQHYTLLDEISHFNINEPFYQTKKNNDFLKTNSEKPFLFIDDNDIGIKFPKENGFEFVSAKSKKPESKQSQKHKPRPEHPKKSLRRIQHFVQATKPSGKIVFLAPSQKFPVDFEGKKKLIDDNILDDRRTNKYKWNYLKQFALSHKDYSIYKEVYEPSIPGRFDEDFFQPHHNFSIFFENELLSKVAYNPKQLMLSPFLQENGLYIASNLEKIPESEIPNLQVAKCKNRFLCFKEFERVAQRLHSAAGIIVFEDDINTHWLNLIDISTHKTKIPIMVLGASKDGVDGNIFSFASDYYTHMSFLTHTKNELNHHRHIINKE